MTQFVIYTCVITIYLTFYMLIIVKYSHTFHFDFIILNDLG